MIRTHDGLKHIDACHFATTITSKREMFFVHDEYCSILWNEIFVYANIYDVDIYGYVIMPDHLHILFWPRGKKTASEFMRGIKSMSAKKILSKLNNDVGSCYGWGPQTPPSKGLWQSTYFDYITTSKYTIQQKIEYMKQNPVVDKIVLKSEDYKWLYINPNFTLN